MIFHAGRQKALQNVLPVHWLHGVSQVVVEDSVDSVDEPATFGLGGERTMPKGTVIAIVGGLAFVAGDALAQAPAAKPAAVPSPATAVIDGDTLRYKGALVHLWGIDAPEKGQTCADGWPAGQMATDYLTGLVHTRTVTCETKPWPATPGQTFAVCKVDGQDLGASMVAAGMAWSNTAQTKDYTVQESQAMTNIMGVHGNACLKAWEWRTQRQGTKSP
jgi:endonuclease YncB( thermonuclease family)